MIHFVSLPHTETTPDYCWCAYTMKQLHIGEIVTSKGHEATLYAGTRNTGTFTEHVEVVTDEDRDRWFGHIDWNRAVFDGWDPAAEWWQTMNTSAIAAIRERIQPGDVIGIIAGRCQQQIADAFPDHRVAEWGCGYEGILPAGRSQVCFESEAWRHFVYGRSGVNDGRWFDTVIPNSFDPADYAFSTDKDNYLLFMGRMIDRKGLPVVGELAKHHRVITAGQGDQRVPGAEHVGVVRGVEKAELLAAARAVLCPTIYVEPFGGVAVEAMLSGTPVISSPFGAFSETVSDGVSGFKCHTLDQFRRAVDALDDLDPKTIREWAMDRYTLSAVAPQYDRWLRRLTSLYSEGWYA